MKAVSRAARTGDGRIAAPPNYILLGVGVALVVLQVVVVGDRVQSPVGNAALVAIGVTLSLYGIYPVSVMNGEFSGALGKLAVAGPAAIGIFLFFVVFQSLTADAQQRRAAESVRQRADASSRAAQRIDDVILLTTSRTDRQHNSRTIGGETVRLLDVDSFDDDRVTSVVDRLIATLRASGEADGSAKAQAGALIVSIVPQLTLGQPYEATAIGAVNTYLARNGDPKAIWKDAIASAAARSSSAERIAGRVKRLPFALISINSGMRRNFRIVSEGSQVEIGGKPYDIPVIANPTKRYVPNLEEAIVLTVASQ